jgi:hypothetical protein
MNRSWSAFDVVMLVGTALDPLTSSNAWSTAPAIAASVNSAALA